MVYPLMETEFMDILKTALQDGSLKNFSNINRFSYSIKILNLIFIFLFKYIFGVLLPSSGHEMNALT